MSVTAAAGQVPRRRFFVVLGGLTAVNLLINVLALITGPLQARLLGPAGRGELALILVVCSLAPFVAGLGLGSYLAREISQTERRGALLGTVTLLSVGLGAVGALFAYPVSRLFGQGNAEVETLIFIGLLVLPISVAGINLHGGYWGIEAWRLYSIMKLLPPLLIAVSYIVLALLGVFTVATAAVAVFVAGLLALIPLAPLLRSTRGWAFDRGMARRGLGFGSKAAVAGVVNQGSARVDQLFIAALVSTRELGFYVVAVTFAGTALMASQALNTMVLPMVATGQGHAIRRILRITLTVMTLAAVLLAVVAGPAIELLFGERFGPSAELARILAFGSIFIAGKGIVSGALIGNGRPGEPAGVEVATFVLLIALLIPAVPAGGAVAAAWVVVATTGLGFALLVVRTRKWLGGRLLEYLVPTPDDVGWLVAAARSRRRAGTGG